jgi:hypothetical protein
MAIVPLSLFKVIPFTSYTALFLKKKFSVKPFTYRMPLSLLINRSHLLSTLPLLVFHKLVQALKTSEIIIIANKKCRVNNMHVLINMTKYSLQESCAHKLHFLLEKLVSQVVKVYFNSYLLIQQAFTQSLLCCGPGLC